MKTKTLLIVSALLAAWSVHAADRIDMNQLPAPVKSALSSAGVNEPVHEVKMRTVDGRTVYDIELERAHAPNPHLRIAADGTVLRDTRAAADAASNMSLSADYPVPVDIPRLKLADLPPPARDTITREAGGREIAAITSDVVDGHPAYMVEFSERGRNPRLYVAENGMMLRPPEKPPVLGLGTTFAQTPMGVQRTIRHEIGDGEITKIDKEGFGHPAAYKVEMKRNNETFELRIAEDGAVLKDSRHDTHPRLEH